MRLDDAIYPILVNVAARHQTITYAELCENLGHPWALCGRSRSLHEALGSLVQRCRDAGLPALSALVINRLKARPGDGYFRMAHAGIDDATERLIAWSKECKAAHRTSYPLSLPDQI